MSKLIVRGWAEYARLWGEAISSFTRWEVEVSGDHLGEEVDGDVLFFNGRDNSEAALLRLIEAGKAPKVVHYVHDLPLDEWGRRWGRRQKWPKGLLLYLELLKRCDVVLTQSSVMVQVIRDFSGASNVVRMDMCLDSKRMKAWSIVDDQASEFHERWGYGYVSRIVPLKGQLDLIKALNQIGKKHRVILAGRKADRGYLISVLKEACNTQRLHLALDAPDSLVYAIAKHVDVAVVPSLFEGWGMFPARAWWFGTPLVLYDIPVFKELYGDYATFVPSGNIDELAAVCKHVRSNLRTNRERCAAKAVEARRRWSMRAFAHRFEELLGG